MPMTDSAGTDDDDDDERRFNSGFLIRRRSQLVAIRRHIIGDVAKIVSSYLNGAALCVLHRTLDYFTLRQNTLVLCSSAALPTCCASRIAVSAQIGAFVAVFTNAGKHVHLLSLTEHCDSNTHSTLILPNERHGVTTVVTALIALDHARLLVGTMNGSLHVFNIGNGVRIASNKNALPIAIETFIRVSPTTPISALTVSASAVPSYSLLAVFCADKIFRLIDTERLTIIRFIGKLSAAKLIVPLSVSYCAVVADSVTVWKIDTFSRHRQIQHTQERIAIAADGNTDVQSAEDDYYDALIGNALPKLSHHCTAIATLNDDIVLCAYADGYIHCWDIQYEEKLLLTLRIGTAAIDCIKLCDTFTIAHMIVVAGC